MAKDRHTRPFLKMHGLGNDFIIFDAREEDFTLADDEVRTLSDRRRGIGCDQLIILRNSARADIFMEIRNADGSRVGACGNATRCVGQLALDETGHDTVSIETDTGLLSAERADAWISVNMGPARLGWDEIPLARDCDTANADFALGPLFAPGCVNMGNPHAVFIVDDADKIDLPYWGPQIETHNFFPERVNTSVASVTDDSIRLRVWERGAGITDACGSAACASVVAATRRGLVDRKATVKLDGGDLFVEWLPGGTVQMTGPATLAFKGEVTL